MSRGGQCLICNVKEKKITSSPFEWFNENRIDAISFHKLQSPFRIFAQKATEGKKMYNNLYSSCGNYVPFGLYLVIFLSFFLYLHNSQKSLLSKRFFLYKRHRIQLGGNKLKYFSSASCMKKLRAFYTFPVYTYNTQKEKHLSSFNNDLFNEIPFYTKISRPLSQRLGFIIEV